MVEPVRRRCSDGLLLAALALTACATEAKRGAADLAEIVDAFPGHYDNLEQAQSDLERHREPHIATTLDIVPIYAPTIGEHVFYLQESAADDPRRIFSQRLAAFEFVKGRGVVESLWTLNEPQRWRDAHLNADLFKSMLPEDYKPVAGCELLWTGKDGKLAASNDPARCRAPPRPGDSPAQLTLGAELGAGELALSSQSRDATGRLVQGNAAEPFYRFRKR